MSANLYISVADFKTLNDITDAGSDAIIESIIEAASRTVDKFCGRIFYQEAVVEYFDGPGTSVYYTKKRPIDTTVAVVLERDRNDDGVFEETISTTDYKVYDNRISLLKYATEGIYAGQASVFYRGQQNWRVTYTAGCAEVPRPVEIATSMLTTYLLTDGATTKKLGDHAKGILHERIGNYDYTVGLEIAKAGVFPPAVASILSLYRQFRIGGRDGQG